MVQLLFGEYPDDDITVYFFGVFALIFPLLSLIRRTREKKLSHEFSCTVKMPLPIFSERGKIVLLCVS